MVIPLMQFDSHRKPQVWVMGLRSCFQDLPLALRNGRSWKRVAANLSSYFRKWECTADDAEKWSWCARQRQYRWHCSTFCSLLGTRDLCSAFDRIRSLRWRSWSTPAYTPKMRMRDGTYWSREKLDFEWVVLDILLLAFIHGINIHSEHHAILKDWRC